MLEMFRIENLMLLMRASFSPYKTITNPNASQISGEEIIRSGLLLTIKQVKLILMYIEFYQIILSKI